MKHSLLSVLALAVTVAVSATPVSELSKVTGSVATTKLDTPKISQKAPQSDVAVQDLKPVIDRSGVPMLAGAKKSTTSSKRADAVEGFVYTNFAGLPQIAQIAGPISLPSGAIPWQYLYYSYENNMYRCDNPQCVYGNNLYCFNGGIYLGYAGTNEALICANLDGTQDISVVVEVGTVEKSSGTTFYATLYDAVTEKQIDRKSIKVPYNRTDIVSATFSAGTSKNVRVEITPSVSNCASFIFQYEVDAAPADFTIAAPTKVSHTVADDHQSFSIASNLPANANYNRAYIYKRTDFPQAVDDYTVYRQDFSSLSYSGATTTNPDRSRCFWQQSFEPLLSGCVRGMANLDGELGLRVDDGWATAADMDFCLELPAVDLTPTKGAFRYEFDFTFSSDKGMLHISRYLFNKKTGAYEQDKSKIVTVGPSDATWATYKYDEANFKYNLEEEFDEIDTSTYDASSVVLVILAANVVDTSTFYVYFDNIWLHMLDVPAGTSALNLVDAVTSSNGSFTVGADLDEENTKYYYTLFGVNRDKYMNETWGDWYLKNNDLVPVTVPRPKAPVFMVGGKEVSGNALVPAKLNFGDLITVQCEDGCTLTGTFTYDADHVLPLENVGAGITFDAAKKTWPACASGYITAHLTQGTYTSPDVTFYYTVDLPEVHVLMGQSNEECLPASMKLAYSSDSHRVVKPAEHRLQLQSVLIDDVDVVVPEAWCPNLRYQLQYFTKDDDANPALTLEPVDVADYLADITVAEGYHSLNLLATPVGKFGQLGATQAHRIYFGDDEALDFKFLGFDIDMKSTLSDTHVVYDYDVDLYPLTDNAHIYVQLTPEGGETQYYTNNDAYPTFEITNPTSAIDLGSRAGLPAPDESADAPYKFVANAETGDHALYVPLDLSIVNNIQIKVVDPDGVYGDSGWHHHTYVPDGNGNITGLDHVDAADAAAPVRYYNLQGQLVANPQCGLFIRVQGNTAKKVAM